MNDNTIMSLFAIFTPVGIIAAVAFGRWFGNLPDNPEPPEIPRARMVRR